MSRRNPFNNCSPDAADRLLTGLDHNGAYAHIVHVSKNMDELVKLSDALPSLVPEAQLIGPPASDLATAVDLVNTIRQILINARLAVEM